MISLVAAMARNRTIGMKGQLPWHIPEDLKWFKRVTTGHPVIMGRKTYDSVGKPLPNRTNFVVTRDGAKSYPGVRLALTLEAALAQASAPDVPGYEEVCVIGGGEIYRQALPLAQRIYLTLIDADYEGDAHFPEFNWEEFTVSSRDERTSPLPFAFVVLERRSTAPAV